MFEPAVALNLLGVEGNSGMLRRLTEDRIEWREVTEAAVAFIERCSTGELMTARAAAVGRVGEAASQAPEAGVSLGRGEVRIWVTVTAGLTSPSLSLSASSLMPCI
jgi:hypothetical protein